MKETALRIELLMEQIHCLCATGGSDDDGYPELYDKIIRYTSQNYAVIYAVEKDPNRTVQHMGNHNMEIEDLVESGALTIIGRNTMYSMERTGLEGHALLNSWHDTMLRLKKTSNPKGILAVGSIEAFFDHAVDPCKLVKYEGMVGKRFKIPFEAICCYSKNAINRLSLGHLLSILNAHHSTVHRTDPYREWQPEKIIELTREVMERELDKRTSDLIFAAIKLYSNVGEGEIIENPVLLEDAIKAILGKPAADVTIRKIKEEVTKLIRF